MLNYKPLLYTVFLLPLLLASAANASEAEALKHLDRAQALLNSGDTKAASIELRNAVKQAPENPHIRGELGRVYLDSGAYAAAAKELSKALQLGAARATTLLPLSEALTGAGQHQAVVDLLADEPKLSPRLLTLRARAELEGGDIESARRDFSATLELAPQQETALLGMARLEVLAGNDGDAKRWIRQAISSAPESPRPWRLLGDLEIKQKQMAKALSSYQTALKLAPDSADIGLRTAAILLDRGDLEAAAKLADPLLARSPNNPALQLLSAAIKLRQGALDQAASILDPLVSRYPDNAQATLYLGQLLLRQKKYERAIEMAQRFQALRPNDPQGSLLLALAHAQGGSADQGRRLLEPLLEQQPHSTELLTALRIAATRQGDYEKAADYESRLADATQAAAKLDEALQQIRDGERDSALQMLGKTADLYPDLHQARLLQYREFIRARQFAEAAAIARDLIRLLPDNVNMQLLLGIALAGQQDYPAAQKAILTAWRANPGSPVIGHRLAILYGLQRQPEKAEAIYRQVLAKHPDHAETMIRLAGLKFRNGDREAGLEALRSAVDAAPGDLRPRTLLSQALTQSGEPEQALKVLLEVQSRFNTDPDYVQRVLQLQMALQDWPEAMETAQRLMTLQPQSALAHLHLAEIQGKQGDTGAMTAEIEQALALDGPSGISSRQLLQLAALSGDLDTARSLLEGLRSKYPADAELATALIALAARQQRFDDALAIATEMEQRYPAQPRWPLMETRTLYRAGRSDAGGQRLREALQRFPNAPGLKMLSAAAALQENDNQDAIAHYLEVIESQPNNIAALNNLAWLSKDSDPKQALIYSQRAARLSRNPQVLDTYGMVLLANQRAETAVKILRIAAKGDSNNTEIQLHLAEALVAAEQPEQAKQILDSLAATEKTAEQSENIRQLRNKL